MVTLSKKNFFLNKEERDGMGFNFGSGFDFPVRPCMAISLLVAGQTAASISWKPSRDMGEELIHWPTSEFETVFDPLSAEKSSS